MWPLLDTSFSLIPQEHRNMNFTPVLSHPEARELALCPAAGYWPWAAEDKGAVKATYSGEAGLATWQRDFSRTWRNSETLAATLTEMDVGAQPQ